MPHRRKEGNTLTATNQFSSLPASSLAGFSKLDTLTLVGPFTFFCQCALPKPGRQTRIIKLLNLPAQIDR